MLVQFSFIKNTTINYSDAAKPLTINATLTPASPTAGSEFLVSFCRAKPNRLIETHIVGNVWERKDFVSDDNGCVEDYLTAPSAPGTYWIYLIQWNKKGTSQQWTLGVKEFAVVQ